MAPTNRKVTIYDIAKLAGASPSTVSAVLSGNAAARRIKEATVEAIQAVAAAQGYTTNLQARGLRQARSGMVGMIIPVHENRFFSSLSQSFDVLARERGLCPVIASTLRDPKEEIRIVETLISYAVDALFIAGATDPEPLGRLCSAAKIPHIYIDLPGSDAPSVISNNYHGAEMLTRQILAVSKPKGRAARNKAYFVGGDFSDHATARRVAAFQAVTGEVCGEVEASQMIGCGYTPRNAHDAVAALSARLGGLPSALFINSLTAFEGAMSYFVTLPPSAFEGSTIGCYDYEPLASFMQFPLYMVRQNSHELIARAYELLDRGQLEPQRVEIEPELIAPRTILNKDLHNLG